LLTSVTITGSVSFSLGHTCIREFTLQQQNVKTKVATKYAVKVLSDFMLEYNYDGEIGTMDIVVLNGILQDFYANVRTSSGDCYSKSSCLYYILQCEFVGIRAAESDCWCRQCKQ
jgi:hypothetical protein